MTVATATQLRLEPVSQIIGQMAHLENRGQPSRQLESDFKL